MDDFVTFGSQPYLFLLAILLFARGMDILSTWVATPNLVLEGNPIAKILGWRWGLPVNFVLCVALAFWPLPELRTLSPFSRCRKSRRKIHLRGFRSWQNLDS